MSLCESNCVFKGYNSSTSKAICDCHIKNDMTYSYEDIDTNNLLNQIESEKSISNLGITQCLNVFGDTDEIKSNSGFYSLLIILAIFIIIFIIFCIKGRHLLEQKIDNVIYEKFEKNNNNIRKKKKKSKTSKEKTIIKDNDNQPNDNQPKIKRKKSHRKNSGTQSVNGIGKNITIENQINKKIQKVKLKKKEDQ